MARIGDSPLEIFPLGLGGNTFGNTTDAAASEAVLDAFVEGGGNHVDTADAYSHWKPGNRGGESETILGEWMRRRGNRHAVQIATKVGAHPELKGLSADTIARAADASLRRLQTDYIDLYYAHFDEEGRPIEEIAGAFDRLVREGKVRAVGISNLSPERVTAWMRTARENGLAMPVALQPEYNLVGRRGYEQRYEPLAREHGLLVFPYYGLASGFLSGKYRTPADLEGAARGGKVKEYLNEDGLRVVDALLAIAKERDAAPATVALAWLLAKPTVTAPLASATRVEQLAELLAAPRLQLSADEVARL
ncbi:aldo/keto reductase, partial [Longimicrobium sp.]|uniref:aldo/keto reductase n=1 Tax=Longimicrobium sp. TaxID=2029185 RepID=UPI002E35BC70